MTYIISSIADEDGDYVAEKIRGLDEHTPGWRDLTHPNGTKMFTDKGMMLDDKGNRSIFDDVDE